MSSVEQIRASSFELDDVQRPRRRHGGERDALAELVEIGRWCVRRTSLHLLQVIGPLLGLDRPNRRRRER